MRLRGLLLAGLFACSQAAPPTTQPRETVGMGGSTTTLPATTSTRPQTTTSTTLAALQGLELQPVAEGLDRPLLVTAAPEDPRLFVLEQPVRVRIVLDGQLLPEPFLDLTALVRAGGERGLLGLAFHPHYADNGRLVVHYSDQRGDTAVVEYRVSGDPDRADPESARLVLAVDQPASNHNGGTVTFGPDGYLYLGLGDGGGGGDPYRNGQDPSTLLGSILRVDLDSGEDPYGIPPDNPFVEGGGAPEVWAYGLRNPWRFSFDEGSIYIGDVGQNTWEEIDVAPAEEGGLNYGWPIMEAAHCYPPGRSCNQEGLVLPLHEYGRDLGCTVIGGYVYRGAAIPELTGHYFFSDLCGGWLRSLVVEDGRLAETTEWATGLGRIFSLGTDAGGELYVAIGEGRVLRVTPVR